VTYLGYPDTTGMAAFDYRLTDPWADPPGLTETLHTEELYRLSAGFLCFRPPADTPDPAPMPSAAGAPFIFGSFNNFAKVSGVTVWMWSRILDRVPGSRLLLKNRALSEPEARNRAIARFGEHGVAPERLLLSGLVPSLYGHLNSYRLVDLALDTFPYAGTTTTFEALWMGVATVTLAGGTHASRVGASILSILGLPALIAAGEDEYVERAAQLAGGGDTLFHLRGELRGRMRRSPLTDETGFARSVESAYRDMWKRWCAGLGGAR
jgi:predicted O-linked N-acetylglucosamine transferase (SPINDLY family)